MNVQLLVIAKAPVPGLVKTRLCPPCGPRQAAAVAAAALSDTIHAAGAAHLGRQTLVLSGDYLLPQGWQVTPQRGGPLGERLAHAFADTAVPGMASLLIGMDTPQVTGAILDTVVGRLDEADAVLGPAEDGGWWVLALRDPAHATVLAGVPMSRVDTGVLTLRALQGVGLHVATAPRLRDVDTAADAVAVAAICPSGRFAAAVRAHVPIQNGLASRSATQTALIR